MSQSVTAWKQLIYLKNNNTGVNIKKGGKKNKQNRLHKIMKNMNETCTQLWH